MYLIYRGARGLKERHRKKKKKSPSSKLLRRSLSLGGINHSESRSLSLLEHANQKGQEKGAAAAKDNHEFLCLALQRTPPIVYCADGGFRESVEGPILQHFIRYLLSFSKLNLG